MREIVQKREAVRDGDDNIGEMSVIKFTILKIKKKDKSRCKAFQNNYTRFQISFKNATR